MRYTNYKKFHGVDKVAKHWTTSSEIKQTTYTFNNFFHPYVDEFIKRLNKGELEEFIRSDIEIEKDDTIKKDFFESTYAIPDEHNKLRSNTHIKGLPKTIDFSVDGTYAIYNWEIFYHVPITVATHLSKNQHFLEAQKWFHFVFNPLTDEKEDPQNPTARYWNFKYFREHTDPKLITQLMEELSKGENNEEMENLKTSIEVWKRTPFNPHEVAKFRPLAYQFDVVMKYIDNLIAWGDSLFRQFTIEALNEATQLYVLASNILGDKPQEVPQLTKRIAKSYNEIKNNLDEFGNVMVEMENNSILNTHTGNENSPAPEGKSIFSQHLYFCIPKNPKLMAYWDLVSDRLFKIRHCMDIEGNVRQIPLFQPSIDPGMLVKAAASGMNVGDIIGGLNQAVSHVKFPIIAQKASELIGEVKSMGSMLLSAIEKGEAEKLTLIRQEQELKILGFSQDIRYLQWKESESAIVSLLKSRETTFERYKHYQTLLGKDTSDFSELETLIIENNELTEENFDTVYAELVEQYTQTINLEEYREEKLGFFGDIISDIGGTIGVSDSELSTNLGLNKGEKMELNVYGPLTTGFQIGSIALDIVAAGLGLLPQVDAHGTPMGVGVAGGYGGVQLSKGASQIATGLSKAADVSTKMGVQSLKLSSYQRRIDDWVFQNNLAAKELEQMGTQLISSLIRKQISKKEYENHKVQIENAKTIDTFFKEQKFANEELYLWMQGEISKTYYEFYKLAFDIAKKAEATMKYELMRKELDSREFIKFNYWDSGRKGLLSGETLALDMKRMEVAYMENNKREFELTKHISLAQISPLSLITLKETGKCTLSLPEWLFNMDFSGHYMRRIKNVSISIPSIVGPYSGVHCTLSLLKNEIRTSTLHDPYDKTEDDDRFRTTYGSLSSIATSSAQNDSGMFELNFNDGRFLPFEGAGVISEWQINLPKENNHFDFSTLSDVVLHMSYTAREGGDLLGNAAKEAFESKLPTETARLFSIKHEFPTLWHTFVQDTTPNKKLVLEIKEEHLPFFMQSVFKGLKLKKENIKLFSEKDNEIEQISIGTNENVISVIEVKKEITLEKIDKYDNIYLYVEFGE